MNRFCYYLVSLLITVAAANAFAQNLDPAAANKIGEMRGQGYSVSSITPIFGQLVKFSFPAGFTNVFENVKGNNYIREAALTGESANQWSQMLTVTGGKGLAAIPNFTPQMFADRMAGGIKTACPSTFTAVPLTNAKIDAYDEFTVYISCGTVNAGPAAHSESLLLIVIKGEQDFYTIQWAERTAASATAIALDEAKWSDRLKKLMPMKLCPIVPGERFPYPSCIGNGFQTLDVAK